MKKLVLFLSVVLLVLLSGCGNNGPYKNIEASGTIESTNIVVSSKSAGSILLVNFPEGEKVNIGDTVLIIDHEQLDIQLLQAKAAKDAAEAQLNLMLKGARPEDISLAEQNFNQAKVNFETAERDKNRMQNLYDSRSITQKQFEDAYARFELMSAQLKSAQENYDKIKKIFRPEEIEQAQANLKKAVSMVDLLKQNIEDCKVYAPVDGFVSKKFIEEGENAVMGGSLLRISNLETVNLVIYIPETDLAKVKLGQSAEIKIDAFKDKVYSGKIIFISPEAEFTPKNIQTPEERTKLVFAVKIEIANPQFELKPGLPADATLRVTN